MKLKIIPMQNYHFSILIFLNNLIGYAGDPFDQRRGCEIEPCSTGPCGTNAECESNGRTAICKVFFLSCNRIKDSIVIQQSETGHFVNSYGFYL